MLFRFLDEPAAPGAWNMAVDESLLWSCAAGEPGFPCLRLYRWEPACLSLGFHQEVCEAVDLPALERSGLDLVRRATGGRAVLHDRELTYSLIASCREGELAGPVMDGYRRISEALALGLRRLGIAAGLAEGDPAAGKWSTEPCFSRLSPAEIAVGDAKVIGSVQLRRGGCLLQHGSIPLSVDPEKLARVTGALATARSRGVEDLLERRLGTGELEECLVRGFAEAFGATVEPGVLSLEEEARAGRLESGRYRTARWTHGRPRRRLGEVA